MPSPGSLVRTLVSADLAIPPGELAYLLRRLPGIAQRADQIRAWCGTYCCHTDGKIMSGLELWQSQGRLARVTAATLGTMDEIASPQPIAWTAEFS